MGEFGSKAINLRHLSDAGFTVPSFVSLSSKTDVQVLEAMVQGSFNPDKLLAIRSSALAEDGTEKSMAGAFHSEVAVSPSGVGAAWSLVVESMPSESENGVIVQEMVFGDFSGVCFADAKTNRVMVNALPGLCKAVVEGHNSDYYEFADGAIQFQHTQDSKEVLVFDQGIVNSTSSTEIIPDHLLLKLVGRCLEVSVHFESIQDIEWTIKDDQIYFLQSRPVTANPWKSQTVKIYDSANVGESYSGIVLPLTLTFAGHLYSQVYEDLLRHSAVSESALKQAKNTFDTLVEPVYGRMYYRMDQWYAFLRMLPGYSRNASNLEQMLMLNARQEDHVSNVRPSLWLRVIYYPLVFWKLALFGKRIRALQVEAEHIFKKAASWDLQKWDITKVDAEIESLFAGVLKRWYLTVENDTVMMSLFAHFSKKGQEPKLKEALAFHSISTDQIQALNELSQRLKTIEGLKKAIEQTNSSAFERELALHSDAQKTYRAYLERFGGRFANELKLETAGVEDSFTEFATIIQMYWSGARKIELADSPSSRHWLVRVFKRFASRRELFRLYRANMFGVIRKLILRKAELMVGADRLEKVEDVFYLEWKEFVGMKNTSDIKQRVTERRAAYAHYSEIDPPAYFTVVNGRWPALNASKPSAESWQGTAASSGTVLDHATVMESFEPRLDEKVGVLVTKRTDPGWTPLMALSKGLVVEHGGMLSHASIVARELQIPGVIGIKDACKRIRSGDMVLVDGDTGLVSIKTDNE